MRSFSPRRWSIQGAADVVLAGGVESYSRRPLRLRTDPDGGPPRPYDQAPFTPWPDRDPDMAEAAEALARRLGISRERQEAWAVAEPRQGLAADHSGEIVPNLNGVTRDAFPRALTAETPGPRAPVVTGSITAATAAVAADAAAICSWSRPASRQGSGASRSSAARPVGANPMEPGLAPLAAIRRIWDG